jgi:methylmalonyl-CoA mutase
LFCRGEAYDPCMTVPSEELRLAAEFPPVTRERWRESALGVLRRSGVAADSPEEALSSTTYDGVTIAPLYDAADLPGHPPPPGRPPYTRGGRPEGAVVAGWDVRQRHAAPDPEAVLADLENGVTSLWLSVGEDAIPLSVLDRVLAPVHLDLAPVVLDAGPAAAAAAARLVEIAERRGVPPAALRGNLGLDPLGLRARYGRAAAAEASGDAVAGVPLDIEQVRRCAADHPGLRAMVVDATPYHDAGGAAAEELGCSLATGVAYLRALTAAGLPVHAALGQLEFRYAADADQFRTIAKLRAARRLWSRVAEVCVAAAGSPGGEPEGQRQHAVTSSAMMTARDPWTNMLRATLACFAAGVGGADAVTVQPFDACLGLPDAFARRIARNTHAILVEESNVARVVDPAGGSWYVERLTEELAARAWEWFQEIERAGGMASALDSGLVAGRLAATRAARSDAIAHRRDPITGVSEFPHLDERPPVRAPGQGLAWGPGPAGDAGARATEGPTEGATEGAGSAGRSAAAAAGSGEPGGALPRFRYAQDFEDLRDLADAQEARPTVFLATLGPVAAHTARASFAANLFAAGGIATVSAGPDPGPIDPDRIAAAYARSGSPVACLCADDRLYGEHAAAVAAALRAAGARRIWLAGKGTYEGVDACLYAGCDALDVLRTTFDDLGVAR